MLESELLYTLSVRNRSFTKVCQLFGLSENEMNDPNAGDWIVDCIKQYQTAAMIAKSMKMRTAENQKVENYHKPPLQNKANPLLKDGEIGS